MGLNIQEYVEIAPNAIFSFIDPRWLESYQMFNNLKADQFLYNTYSEFSFVLFYELDAWVFTDELDFWCKKDYDYIGAPWFAGYGDGNSLEMIGVGNGGFSLRKISSAIKVLKRLQQLKKSRIFWYRSRLQSFIPFDKVLGVLKENLHLIDLNLLQNLMFSFQGNEDIFWTQFVAKAFKDFNVAPPEDALRFSFEVNPAYLFDKNNQNLPFGCHAWEKYEPEFWKRFI